ncbi:ribbon-helix-helix domain-containing protein [Alteromonas sp. C1M14]|uniref:ribbon-helix-helix domain-containing protein n=1 Tax=Alteromonas sp. C1M14 TaxID=2841567 RepID=UPI001C08AE60|nr:ribbon-helix-helix domain-containing protein [Alteromonas sp. C1M14]MBU2978136.1 ribbon-helix-helix domain-containing protein [Alteromonas sp. C1M14]
MCGLFINADPDLWKSTTRSLRIDGVVTSIRMETFFWNILQEIAFRDDLAINQLISKLYLEALDADHDIGNFTSFLRVCCTRYLSMVADGHLQRDSVHPLVDMDAKNLINQEAQSIAQRKSRYLLTRTEKH